MNVNIRDIDPQVVKLMDEIIAKENYSSRSQFVEEVIKLYVCSRDKFFLKALTPTVKCLVDEQLHREHEATEAALNLTYNINVKVLAELEKIQSLFLPDIYEDE